MEFKEFGKIESINKLPQCFLDDVAHIGWNPSHNLITFFIKTKTEEFTFQIWRDKTIRTYIEDFKSQFSKELKEQKKRIDNDLIKQLFD